MTIDLRNLNEFIEVFIWAKSLYGAIERFIEEIYIKIVGDKSTEDLANNEIGIGVHIV